MLQKNISLIFFKVAQNVLAITIKIGDVVIPLNTRIVSKQGHGNTDKPRLFIVMIQEVLDFFDAEDIDIRKYSITFDSWYGSKKLIDILLDLGFVSTAYLINILVTCLYMQEAQNLNTIQHNISNERLTVESLLTN